jgi:hypothetical protein
MKGYKGFDKVLKCRDKQYVIGQEETEEGDIKLCEKGLHFCENPHDVFGYYSAGDGHRFCEVEASEVSEEEGNDSKRVAKRLTVKAEVSVFQICKIAVSTFFENFGFQEKIKSADTNNAGNYGAANAGDYGAANAGYYGAANAGDRGAANAGDYGAASVKENGVAICASKGKVKGGNESVLVLVDRDKNGTIIDFAAAAVDGVTILPDTWYCLEGGKILEITNYELKK